MVKRLKEEKPLVNRKHTAVLVVLALAIALIGALGITAVRMVGTISKYQLLEMIDNQACRYLDNQPAVNGSFNLDETASAEYPKLTYTCLNGETTKTRTIQGKDITSYDMGASVRYFSDNKAAERFAQQQLNPQRYWGVANPVGNIEQTSHFIFVVTDEEIPYFDAYTVKANAVLRVSLPCKDKDAGKCYEEAEAMLNRELKGINVL